MLIHTRTHTHTHTHTHKRMMKRDAGGRPGKRAMLPAIFLLLLPTRRSGPNLSRHDKTTKKAGEETRTRTSCGETHTTRPGWRWQQGPRAEKWPWLWLRQTKRGWSLYPQLVGGVVVGGGVWFGGGGGFCQIAQRGRIVFGHR